MRKRTWLIFRLIDVKKLVKHYKKLPLTSVSKNKTFLQMLNKEQNPACRTGRDEGSVASKADSSNDAWQIKIFLN
jgi:hypothetical protein